MHSVPFLGKREDLSHNVPSDLNKRRCRPLAVNIALSINSLNLYTAGCNSQRPSPPCLVCSAERGSREGRSSRIERCIKTRPGSPALWWPESKHNHQKTQNGAKMLHCTQKKTTIPAMQGDLKSGTKFNLWGKRSYMKETCIQNKNAYLL